jgi:hypothetical protein
LALTPLPSLGTRFHSRGLNLAQKRVVDDFLDGFDRWVVDEHVPERDGSKVLPMSHE